MVFPIMSLIVFAFLLTAIQNLGRVKSRTETGQLRELQVACILFRAEITGGVMGAVGFRRRGIIFDVALRYRFAKSLEHYNNFIEWLSYSAQTFSTIS